MNGDSTTFLGSQCQCLAILSVNNFFPDIQSQPLLAQLDAASSHPVTCCLEEETTSHVATPSIQAVVESDEVLPELSFLAA